MNNPFDKMNTAEHQRGHSILIVDNDRDVLKLCRSFFERGRFTVYTVGSAEEALGFLNKLAGSFFGILKAAVILSIALLLINQFNDDLISHQKKKNSLLYGPISSIAPVLWQGLENFDFKDSKIEDLKEEVEEIAI